MNRVEDNELFKIDVDVSTIARDELAEMLQEILEAQMLGADVSELELDILAGHSPVNEGWRGLVHPILADALADISMNVVAEAMLRKCGKWAPDREPPEVI